ncbi:MAG TPA: sugar-binding transcriptional regulator [Longilinea sp.]|nr:sugar-binding transcriptional regulator [Longilinea sp.]
MNELIFDVDNARLISRILTLYYQEDKSQGEIGNLLGLSTAKVNRLIKYAREMGMVEININPPFKNLFDLENKFEESSGVNTAIIVPHLTDDPNTTIQQVGAAAARYLEGHLRDGDTITMGGGRALSEMVQALNAGHHFDVKVVPATGGVQGRHYTDTNNLAAEAARKLGGTSFQLHAPAYTDTPEERNAFLALRHVKDILDLSRKAQVAVCGIGALSLDTSSYLQFSGLSNADLKHIQTDDCGIGEILAQVINSEGEPCARKYSDRVIGLSVEELRTIPLTIGLAATSEKVAPIAAALKGHYFKTIVTDEITALEVLKHFN